MTNLRNLRIPLAVAAVAITCVFVLSSWDFKNTYAAWNDNGYDNCDTIPKKEKKIRDLDDVLDELNGIDFKMDMEKMHFGNFEKEMAKAMKEFDTAKIQKEVQESMQKIEWDKMKMDFDKLKEI